MKSHAHWFPLENPRKPVLHSFKSWIQTECEANEANFTISSISLLTLKLTLLARCCRLPQLLLFVYFVSKGRLFSATGSSCGWLLYHHSGFVLVDDECGPPLLAMTREPLLILMVRHRREVDDAQPANERLLPPLLASRFPPNPPLKQPRA